MTTTPGLFTNHHPALVTAIQFNDYDDYFTILHWMKAAGDSWALTDDIRYMTPIMVINTAAGAEPAHPGDWVTRDTYNTFRVVSRATFDSTYGL